MNIMLLCLFLGGLRFVEQDIDGLHVGEVSAIGGKPSLNFRCEDIDRDGELDLVLPRQVRFQRAGLFPANRAALLPVEGATCDLWNGVLYARMDDRIEVYAWADEAWEMLLGHTIDWPPGALSVPVLEGLFTAEIDSDSDVQAPVRFRRFLYDLNSDGYPEILVPAQEGLCVYARIGDTYRKMATWDIYPISAPIQPESAELWPVHERRLNFPPLRNVLRLAIEPEGITVVARYPHGEEEVRFRVRTRSLDPDEDFNLLPSEWEEWETEPLPRFLEPCRLNRDGRIDFAGGHAEYVASGALPHPVFNTVVTTNAGRDLQRVRSTTYRPRVSFLDFDSDGDLDMIIESTGMLDHGIRESLNRFLFHRSISHRIDVRYQNALGEFAEIPNHIFRVSIRLKEPPYQNGPQFRRYQTGRLFDITGDFDADGYADFAVRDRPGRVSIYLNRNGKIRRASDISLAIPDDREFAVADVDGDGYSDIVFQSRGRYPDFADSSTTVYFARTSLP
ncbi:MAG: VCBS repeat-containing protein [Candidatus Hydrogenedentes bacterium]|nr:VCBS repeat-containing protein [Candidatus Hydrogenedentota bacterium]